MRTPEKAELNSERISEEVGAGEAVTSEDFTVSDGLVETRSTEVTVAAEVPVIEEYSIAEPISVE